MAKAEAETAFVQVSILAQGSRPSREQVSSSPGRPSAIASQAGVMVDFEFDMTAWKESGPRSLFDPASCFLEAAPKWLALSLSLSLSLSVSVCVCVCFLSEAFHHVRQDAKVWSGGPVEDWEAMSNFCGCLRQQLPHRLRLQCHC